MRNFETMELQINDLRETLCRAILMVLNEHRCSSYVSIYITKTVNKSGLLSTV